MTYNVHQHWDPLKVCAVGRSYPPEFYSFITNSRVRAVMERIAEETEEDYQKLIKLLHSFGVETVRTHLDDNFDKYLKDGKYMIPPMCPRDETAMIGDKFFMPPYKQEQTWERLRGESWPETMPDSWEEFPDHVRDEITNQFGLSEIDFFNSKYKFILDKVKSQGNEIISDHNLFNTAMTLRIGRDILHGTNLDNDSKEAREILEKSNKYLPSYRNHIVNSAGHADSVLCAVKPGLIVSIRDIPDYSQTFPDWEVVYLEGESWSKMSKFLSLKFKNKGKWWVPGEELNDEFTDFVESWLGHWMGYAEETVFDVNMLVIDEKNVICTSENPIVFDAFKRHGVTPHVCNFRHRYFWDGGLHCITSDLHREGQQQDYFPERS